MDMISERWLLYTLKIGALLSIFIVFLRMTYEHPSLGGILLILIGSVLGFVFIFFDVLMLTNSRGLINFGAFASLMIGLAIIGLTLFALFKGNNLNIVYVNGWTTTQYLSQILVAIIGGLYLVFETGSRSKVLERGLLVGVIPLLIIVESMSSTAHRAVFSWTVQGFTAIAIVTLIALVVLFFSNLQHSIAFPFIVGFIAVVLNAVNVKHYLFDKPKKISFPGLGSKGLAQLNSFEATVTQRFTIVAVLQLVVAVLLVACCCYIAMNSREGEQTVGKLKNLLANNPK